LQEEKAAKVWIIVLVRAHFSRCCVRQEVGLEAFAIRKAFWMPPVLAIAGHIGACMVGSRRLLIP